MEETTPIDSNTASIENDGSKGVPKHAVMASHAKTLRDTKRGYQKSDLAVVRNGSIRVVLPHIQ